MKSSRLLRGMLVILVFFVIIAGWDAVGHPGWPLSSPTKPTEVVTTGSTTPQLVQRTLPATLNVSGTQWGVSTCYIGAAEGSSRFSIADLQDLGINTYRVYGGMNRWEAHDDGSAYGLPTITQIQRNPNVINWASWDTAMTNPSRGSDYWWDPKLPEWQGNARTLFSTLNAAHIRIMIALRNQDDQHNPQWMANPPTTTADWNEWWEHVFATVYWLNVRNHYHVYDFEIGNEPNIPAQGWRGTQAQYFTFARYTSDAIAYVFKTYLPRQAYHVYAPTTADGTWPRAALQQAANTFDSVDIHYYGLDIRNNVERIHTWMNETGNANKPLWLTEWGTYSDRYGSVPFGVSLINNLIYGSSPGLDYVYGSAIFSLYDFDTTPLGLIRYDGVHRADYYALRLGIRALQGCRPTYQSLTNNNTLLAITTKDRENNLYVLVTNTNSKANYSVTANLSALLLSASCTSWQFDAHHLDTVTGKQVVRNGVTTFVVPANGAILIKVSPTAASTVHSLSGL